MTTNALVTHIEQLFARRGAEEYHGEAVTQLEHALQAASAAEREGAAPDLVVAALLHDVGHLLHPHGEDAAGRGIDDRHEALGDRFLRKHFGRGVTEPVRLHVAAKRYLCATDPRYRGELSPASQRSLDLQGGPMTAEEIAGFEREEYFQRAVQLRRWDDAAKAAGLATPGLAHFLEGVRG